MFNFFKQKWVDSVLNDFHKVIARLEAVAVHHQEKHDDKTTEAGVLVSEAKEHLEESIRANVIVGKLKGLFA